MATLSFVGSRPAPVETAFVLMDGELKEVDPNTPIKDIARSLVSGKGTVNLMEVTRINGTVYQSVGDFTQSQLTMNELGYAVSNMDEVVRTIEIRVVVKGSVV